jgi:hypothetical protein
LLGVGRDFFVQLHHPVIKSFEPVEKPPLRGK